MKKISYWIDHTEDADERTKLIAQHKALGKEMHKVPIHRMTNKKFTFVRYADDWLVGVCGTKKECEELKAEIGEFLADELKLELSEEKTHITHSSKKVRFLGYDICVRRNQKVKGHRMKNGKWRKSRSLHMKVQLTIPHREKIESFMFAKGIIVQTKDGRIKPTHRAGLLNLSDSEILEHYNAEMRGLLNYYNLAVDYHTLDYFCYLMEYSCLKTIANKHKSTVRAEDIDLDNNVIHVRSTISRGLNYREFVKDGTKTDTGKRDIPISKTGNKQVQIANYIKMRLNF